MRRMLCLLLPLLMLLTGCGVHLSSQTSQEPFLMQRPSASAEETPQAQASSLPEASPYPLNGDTNLAPISAQGLETPALPEGSWYYHKVTQLQDGRFSAAAIARRVFLSTSEEVLAQDGQVQRYSGLCYLGSSGQSLPAWLEVRQNAVSFYLDGASSAEASPLNPEDAPSLMAAAQEQARLVLDSDAYDQPPDAVLTSQRALDGDDGQTLAYEFVWTRQLDGFQIPENSLTATVNSLGCSSLELVWDVFQPTSAARPSRILGFEEALHSLNYVRSQHRAGDGASLASVDLLCDAAPVLTNVFTGQDCLYAPAWEFRLCNGQAEGERPLDVLVDMATGAVYTPAEGRLATAYASLDDPASAPSYDDSMPDTPTRILERFLSELWTSLYTMKAPSRLPSGVQGTAANYFDLYWAKYRIRLVEEQDYDERLHTLPVVSVHMLDTHSENNSQQFSFRAYISLSRSDGVPGVCFDGNASFVWVNGGWLLTDAGCAWNGSQYQQLRAIAALQGNNRESALLMVEETIQELEQQLAQARASATEMPAASP